MVEREAGVVAGPDPSIAPWVTVRAGASGYRAEAAARGHALLVDEPVAVGGTDSGPSPYELLLSALGGCMAITLRMYADRKGWPLTGVEVRLRSGRSHEADCEQCDRAAVGPGLVERQLVLHGPLDDLQRQRLRAIGDRCPLSQTLARGLRVADVTSA